MIKSYFLLYSQLAVSKTNGFFPIEPKRHKIWISIRIEKYFGLSKFSGELSIMLKFEGSQIYKKNKFIHTINVSIHIINKTLHIFHAYSWIDNYHLSGVDTGVEFPCRFGTVALHQWFHPIDSKILHSVIKWEINIYFIFHRTSML